MAFEMLGRDQKLWDLNIISQGYKFIVVILNKRMKLSIMARMIDDV